MAGMAQAGKEVLVEALVAEPADEALDEGVSGPLCIWPPARLLCDPFQPPMGLERSSNRMANGSTAVRHPLTVREVFSRPRMARWISFSAASSDGKDPLVLMAFLITRSRLSMAFVVWITRRISGLKAKNGITASQARRLACAIEGECRPHSVPNASSASRAASAVSALQTSRSFAATALRSFQEQKFSEWRTRCTMQGEGRPGNRPVAWFSPERAKPRIDRGLREGGGNRLGNALQPVDARDQDVLDPAVGEFGHDRQPELRPLVLGDPEPEHLALAVAGDAEGQVHGLVLDGPAVLVADLHPQSIKDHNGTGGVQGAGAPFLDLVEHGVGHSADETGETSGP